MSHILIGVSEATQRLTEMITGAHITGFETGDMWTLKLGNTYRIAFHTMSSTKEDLINQALRNVDQEMLECTDPEEVSWATLLASVTRQTVLKASIENDASLTLHFEHGVTITIRSDTHVVDWQWCITKYAADPYAEEAELACFTGSEISARNFT
ncbi:DUF6188 family protein [Halocynthiibacter styelae]|uniref:Uncharacterized protein n=1 Tax=Halocynthiibacter styelae TaxID=2761955 RepID=A0A8J7IV67_9RHOB|nr:DUF6188 family protein [Paenihalocynthiibacter styelae]MBI1493369.1 hypothetical protein [Paenihalocynthiibacter styelae]